MSKKKTTAKKGKNTKSAETRKLLPFLLKWTIVIGLWCGIFLAGLCAYYATELPDITKQAAFDRKNSIIVKDSSGKIVARYGDVIGTQVSVDTLPPHLVQAVLAIEDRRFYYHFGLDPIGITRALFVNIKDGGATQGGSTITQQLAKNLFLSRERKLKRKIQEAMLAIWLEYELTKDEILSAYLNRVYLGSGTYGVDAAARLYFETPASEVNLRQSATLAGLLKAPSKYAPNRNPSLSKKRTDLVLSAMVDAGYITQEEADGDLKAPPKPTQKPTNELADRFYTDWIVDELNALIGTPTEDIIVETTLNSNLQGAITQSISTVLGQAGQEKNISEGAMVLMRPNGEVVALVGGRNYNASQFNRATQSLRPPGSSFKPIVYLTALEQGWGPYDMILDAPITDSRYRPKNFGNKYSGEVTLEEALTFSLNTAAVRLMREVGPSAVLNTAARLGIISELQPDLSLALGSSGITLLEMAGSYAVLANGGHEVKPYGITKITAKESGELYYQRPADRGTRRVFRASDIQNITAMMNSVMQYGTGRGAQIGVPAAGKTGTSNESRDALFLGFTRELVGAVWLGNDDNSPMKNVTGGSHPARIWREVMTKARGRYAPIYNADFEAVSGFEDMLGRLFFNGGNTAKDRGKTSSQWGNPDRPAEGTNFFPSQSEDSSGETSLPESQRYNN